MIDVGSLSDYSVLETSLINEIPIRKNIQKNMEKIIENFNRIKNGK